MDGNRQRLVVNRQRLASNCRQLACNQAPGARIPQQEKTQDCGRASGTPCGDVLAAGAKRAAQTCGIGALSLKWKGANPRPPPSLYPKHQQNAGKLRSGGMACCLDNPVLWSTGAGAEGGGGRATIPWPTAENSGHGAPPPPSPPHPVFCTTNTSVPSTPSTVRPSRKAP
jgi:hypothetical protein